MRVEYRTNNSGGRWWLTDQNWLDLEKAGWVVDWFRTSNYHQERCAKYGGDPLRWLGALANDASLTARGLRLKDAVREWERITGQDSCDVGCPCCGPPHSFELTDDDGNWVDSGPSYSSKCEW